GATITMPAADMFWGDRYGQLTDPLGHKWSIATHKQDLTPEQVQQNMQAAFAQEGGHGCKPDAPEAWPAAAAPAPRPHPCKGRRSGPALVRRQPLRRPYLAPPVSRT